MIDYHYRDFVEGGAKLLITGAGITQLGCTFECVFDETEVVMGEVVMEGVLRCRTPRKKNGQPGSVTLFVRSSSGAVSYSDNTVSSTCRPPSRAMVNFRTF